MRGGKGLENDESPTRVCGGEFIAFSFGFFQGPVNNRRICKSQPSPITFPPSISNRGRRFEKVRPINAADYEFAHGWLLMPLILQNSAMTARAAA